MQNWWSEIFEDSCKNKKGVVKRELLPFENDFTMLEYLPYQSGRQLIIRTPATILSHTELSFNQKLLLGLDYTLSKKLGYNKMTNKKVGEMLNLHPNIVCYCRRHLVKTGFLEKRGREHYLTKKHEELEVDDRREVILPHQVYKSKIPTGAKLLWGEYNSISKGKREYFASREYTAKRLNCSVESVSSWTNNLSKGKFLKFYNLCRTKNNIQKIVITEDFQIE